MVYRLHLKLSHHLSQSVISTSLVICKNQEIRRFKSRTHEQMGKKHKAQGSEMKEKTEEMVPLYTDTACNRDTGISTWEGMYRLLEEENPKVMKVDSTAGS